MTISIPVPWGEVHDKITILEIKRDHLSDPAKRANVERELAVLTAARDQYARPDGLAPLVVRLATINAKLWQIEDDIRACERRGDFGPAFIDLARAVYRTNDQRAAVKRQITDLYGGGLVEEKSYAAY
ncbi:MAG: hypothetical protein EAZ99_09390 [Alphaproteobacteria bacterium]|nr:hypothetical protein [Alphaproteobacteria bacterium]TAD89592.1 MAG: hypothetical protein EAZ99_09390 [Alphaproteobacteria bacterium]